jgi:hypothetical protein
VGSSRGAPACRCGEKILTTADGGYDWMCSKSPNYAWQAALGKNGHLDNDHLMKQQEAIEADLHAGTTPKPYAAYIEDSFFYPAIYDTRTEGKRGDVDSGAKFMWASSGPDGPGAFKDFMDIDSAYCRVESS